MIQRYLLAAALVAAFAMPAMTATAKTMKTAKTYYAEQSVKTKYCYAVSFKPNGKTTTMIGTASFPSLSKALAAISADKTCKVRMVHKAKTKTTM